MKPEERLGYQLKRAQLALRNTMDTRLAELGLTSPQYAVLCALDRSPGASNADLARYAFVTPQTMIRIVAQLEDKGFVERTPDPNDARRKQTHLTERGRAKMNQANTIVAEIDTQMTRDLDDAERDQVAAALAKCARALLGDG